MANFEEAKDKVLMGKERRSMILSEEEKKTTAYHEGGHALVAKLLPGSDPVHKVTIIPRGRALGVTMQLPTDDRHSYNKTFLENNLAILFAGRVAEEMIFNQITTGAGNDIERATKTAKKMVCEWGMSEALGPINFAEAGEVFLGRDMTRHNDYSEETARLIDSEVRRILNESYELSKKLLQENIEPLHRIAAALLERETISGEEVDLLIEGKELPPQEEKPQKAQEQKENDQDDKDEFTLESKDE